MGGMVSSEVGVVRGQIFFQEGNSNTVWKDDRSGAGILLRVYRNYTGLSQDKSNGIGIVESYTGDGGILDQYTNEIPKQSWPWGRQGFGDVMRWGTYLPVSESVVCDGSHQRRRTKVLSLQKFRWSKSSDHQSAIDPKKGEARDSVYLPLQLRSLGSLYGASGRTKVFST